MSELSKSLGTMEFDGLIADINPKLVVSGGTIRKLSKADTIKRGTVLLSPAALLAITSWSCWAPLLPVMRCLPLTASCVMTWPLAPLTM